MNDAFKFRLKQMVRLELSGERGYVVARMDQLDSCNMYRVRYQAGDGRQVETWWDESALLEVK